MLSLKPTPAVRAAIFGVIVLTAAAVLAAGLHLLDRQRAMEGEMEALLTARTGAIAAAVTQVADDDAPLLAATSTFAELAEQGWDGTFALIDVRGRIFATNDASFAETVDWARLVEGVGTGGTMRRGVGGTETALAAYPVGSGQWVAGVQPLNAELSAADVWPTIIATAVFWAFLLGLYTILTWYTGPRTAAELERLANRIVKGDVFAQKLVREAAGDLGPIAMSLMGVAESIDATRGERHGQRDHVGALYQVNPHYLLLATLDGDLIEANPAFYAITGLPTEAIRGGRAEALADAFPLDPLMEMAERSLKEGSAITDIEYALIDRNDRPRPVQVSLRSFQLDGEPVVLIQASDVTVRRDLERKVSAFSDSLDLMVDQRVARLAAGQQTLRRLLDAAGMVVASFDPGGNLRRWSGGARALTGRQASEVPHFSAVSGALGLPAAERAAFTEWFWNPSADPLVAHHVQQTLDGDTVTRRILWTKVAATTPGQTDHLTMIGLAMPPEAPAPEFSGDGRSGTAPHAGPDLAADAGEPAPEEPAPVESAPVEDAPAAGETGGDA